jgi:hypothetical protein
VIGHPSKIRLNSNEAQDVCVCGGTPARQRFRWYPEPCRVRSKSK